MPELDKAYNPSPVQEKLYARWLQSGLYHADPTSQKPPYAIVIPPPNVTGVLTLGHVLNNTIQDILCRRARLQGCEVLWLPGTDHAGLATQTAVEKALRKPDTLPPTVRHCLTSKPHLWDTAANKPRIPLTKHHIPREDLLDLVWAWTRDRGGTIIQQLKKLGCSCDWQRERFTMDDHYARAVQQAFIDLYHRGYIYRGKRMVNWCPASLTAISDEEVIPTPQNSTLYTMRYETVEHPGHFVEIATTRPETLMGDTAVAVNPTDPRYRHLIGKHLWRPVPREKIPIIADSHVDHTFGTGALKVTPAHDRADFDIGLRHHLPIIDILTPDARINCPAVPELHGLDRFEARKKSVEMLAALGLLIKEEPYQNTVGYSERGQVPIEPRLSEQWFLDYKKMLGGDMIPTALRVVREGFIRFHPARWEKVYTHWLENIQDWCLSRQIIWGHRIPVWYRDGHTLCQLDSPGEGWTQDPDCLDTWASSWLWAYATMDQPTRQKFYPTSVLVTGPDIIFLWVARMIIAGLEFEPSGTDDPARNIPFKNVYFTGLIRDAQGRKLSKSLGNSPDPLDLIEKYGADGLRFGLLRIAPQGQDIRYDEKQIEEGRNFCNKLWNAARFRAHYGPVDPAADPAAHTLSPFAQHTLHKLHTLITDTNTALDNYQFSTAAQHLYTYTWDDFCARYIESAKAAFTAGTDTPLARGTLATLDYCLSRILRLLHPYCPFITEEIWTTLRYGPGSIQTATWPTTAETDLLFPKLHPAHIRLAADIYTAVDSARALRGEYQIPNNQKIRFLLLPATPSPEALRDTLPTLTTLLNATQVDLITTAPPRTPFLPTPIGELYMPLEGLIDPHKERARLEKEIQKCLADIQREETKLANPDMCAKAPPERVTQWQTTLEEARHKLSRLQTQLDQLS
jgi:valyl-tRNA synthetase